MKRLIASSLIVLACATAAYGKQVLREISWAKLKQTGQLASTQLPLGQSPASAGLLNTENPAAGRAAWWDDRMGGLIGGIFGSVFGCVGALIGILGGMGKARPLVLGLMMVMVVIGLLLLATAGAALACSQPYAVWYPLLLSGFLLTAIMGGLLPVARRGYEQRELRKMTALDTNVTGASSPDSAS
jgi:hypothetical protein